MIETSDGALVAVPGAPEQRREDPTGVGHAFRAGLLAGLPWQVSLERSAQIGSMVATSVADGCGDLGTGRGTRSSDRTATAGCQAGR